MTAHREAVRHPWTEPGVQADSSVVRPAMGPGRAALVERPLLGDRDRRADREQAGTRESP